MITDDPRVFCIRQGCRNKLARTHPWYPYCSNECEQRVQVDAARRGASLNEITITETVRQLDLETASPWTPRAYPPGTLEHYLSNRFELYPGERFSRLQLRDLARSVIGSRVNERNITEAIRELRRGGWPIISSSGEEGYWLSWEPADLDQLEQTLRGRSLDMLKTLSAVRRARSRVGRVPVLDDMVEMLERGEL